MHHTLRTIHHTLRISSKEMLRERNRQHSRLTRQTSDDWGRRPCEDTHETTPQADCLELQSWEIRDFIFDREYNASLWITLHVYEHRYGMARVASREDPRLLITHAQRRTFNSYGTRGPWAHRNSQASNKFAIPTRVWPMVTSKVQRRHLQMNTNKRHTKRTQRRHAKGLTPECAPLHK